MFSDKKKIYLDDENNYKQQIMVTFQHFKINLSPLIWRLFFWYPLILWLVPEFFFFFLNKFEIYYIFIEILHKILRNYSNSSSMYIN